MVNTAEDTRRAVAQVGALFIIMIGSAEDIRDACNTLWVTIKRTHRWKHLSK